MKLLKKKLITTFGRKSFFIKTLSIFKNSFSTFLIILKINFKYSFIFLPKIIFSIYFIEFKTSKKNYLKQIYCFDHKDWLSVNYDVWKKYLSNFTKINYLEIGSFEGRSAVFVGELSNTKKITCVDTFEGSDEHNEINFQKVYENCSNNLNQLKNINTSLIKSTSDNFFSQNQLNFNVIYIDGSHFCEDVKRDFVNSYNCLEKNGILICDDFLWSYYKSLKDNPIAAILDCYQNYKKNLKVEFLNYQIIFKKLI